MQSIKKRKPKPIPVSAAKHIAKAYNYDQVIVYARRTADNGQSIGNIATYGISDALKEAVHGCIKQLTSVLRRS